MRLVTLRIETILKELTQKIATQTQRKLSEVTRDLIDLGMGVLAGVAHHNLGSVRHHQIIQQTKLW